MPDLDDIRGVVDDVRGGLDTLGFGIGLARQIGFFTVDGARFLPAVVANAEAEAGDPAREIAVEFVALALQDVVLEFIAFAQAEAPALPLLKEWASTIAWILATLALMAILAILALMAILAILAVRH